MECDESSSSEDGGGIGGLFLTEEALFISYDNIIYFEIPSPG